MVLHTSWVLADRPGNGAVKFHRYSNAHPRSPPPHSATLPPTVSFPLITVAILSRPFPSLPPPRLTTTSGTSFLTSDLQGHGAVAKGAAS